MKSNEYIASKTDYSADTIAQFRYIRKHGYINKVHSDGSAFTPEDIQEKHAYLVGTGMVVEMGWDGRVALSGRCIRMFYDIQ